MHRQLFTGLIALVFLASCTHQHGSSDSPAARSASQTGGGSDGGGNTYQGKPLESYAQDVTKLKAFQIAIAPLLLDLEKKHLNRPPEDLRDSLDVLRNLLLSAFTQKMWLFVPGPLKSIPQELLNSAVQTDQAILQGFDRVWIDKNIWDTMNPEDQSTLLVHESLMGLKILHFASDYRLLKAAKGDHFDPNDNANRIKIDATINLVPRDYVDVQKTTDLVIKNYTHLKWSEWNDLLNQANFKFSYDWFNTSPDMTPQALGVLLHQSTVSGFLPTNGYNMSLLDTGSPSLPNINNQTDLYNYLQSIREVCSVKATVIDSALDLELHGKNLDFHKLVPLPSNFETRLDDLWHEGRLLKLVGLEYVEQTPRPDGGYTYYNIFLSFSSYQLANVSVQEMVCSEKDCFSPSINVDVKGGLQYECSDNHQLLKP